MNGKMVANKPLYVGLHQPKDQRRAMLTAHFAQRSLAVAAAPYAAPQQVYFGHPALGKSHRRLQSLDFRNIWSQEWGLALQL